MKMSKKCDYFEHKKPKSLKQEGEGDSGVTAMAVQEDIKSTCFIQFSKFIREVLVRMKQYKDELLVSCIGTL
jgi:DNA-dependent protein kinase catalytic subunit